MACGCARCGVGADVLRTVATSMPRRKGDGSSYAGGDGAARRQGFSKAVATQVRTVPARDAGGMRSLNGDRCGSLA